MQTSSLKVILVWTFVLFISIQEAAAYLDPGSGSMLLQILVAAVAAVAVGIKAFWSRIISLFGRSAANNADDSDDWQ